MDAAPKVSPLLVPKRIRTNYSITAVILRRRDGARERALRNHLGRVTQIREMGQPASRPPSPPPGEGGRGLAALSLPARWTGVRTGYAICQLRGDLNGDTPTVFRFALRRQSDSYSASHPCSCGAQQCAYAIAMGGNTGSAHRVSGSSHRAEGRPSLSRSCV